MGQGYRVAYGQIEGEARTTWAVVTTTGRDVDTFHTHREDAEFRCRELNTRELNRRQRDKARRAGR